MKLGDFVEIEIVGDDFGVPFLGQFQQLEIDFLDGGKIVRHNLNLQIVIGLHPLEHIQAAAAALAFGAVSRVSHDLQFTQDKFGNDESPVHKARIGNVGDAAVNDHRGIENLEALPGDLFA